MYDGMIEIDSTMLFNFRKNACEWQSDGFDRKLWFDRKNNRFFKTCETKSTEYVFNNNDDILLLISVKGDNNANGLEEVCEGCSGCGELKETVFEDCLRQKLEEWYPITPFNWQTGEYEDIEFEEV